MESDKDKTSRSSRIAKNSLFLYLRMFLTLCVGLFTSRIVLQALGVENYGVYNVVGGVVAAFSFLNMSLTNASSRFYSVAIGEGDAKNLKLVSNCIITIHYILAVIVLILVETIGLWFLSYKLQIPDTSRVAAMWVFQCSVVTMFVGIVSTPYNAMIISHEKMKAFAYVSIFETFAKLGVAYLLLAMAFSWRLISYAILLVLVQLSVRFLYTIYCKRNFEEAQFNWQWSRSVSGSILKFASWTMNGNLAVIGYTQGINLLLNIFFGPAVNAARGIAVQVQSAVRQFFMSFLTAVNPQVIKSYTIGDLSYMHSLVAKSSKFSFFLILILALPISINVDWILSLWLTEVPPYTGAFIKIMLCVCLINTMGTPLNYSIHATGKLKVFQLVEGGILLSVVPIAWVGLKFFHITPVGVFSVYLAIEILAQISRIIVVCPRIKFPIKDYLRRVVAPVLLVLAGALPIPFILSCFKSTHTFGEFLLNVAICETFVLCSIFLLGMTKNERTVLKNKIGGIISFRVR